MSGYTRQSVADIIASAVIKAAPVNAEFNALRDAFAAGTGHKHDNSTGQGGYIPLVADTDGNNKVVVDTVNNRISVFVEVGGSPVEQLRIQDGVVVPVTDNDIDLGTSVLEFKNLYIDGIAKIDTLTVDENATIAGTLGVTGLSTLPTVNVDGGTIDGTVIGGASAQAITGTNITANTGFSGTLTGNVTGNLTGNVTGDVTGNVTGNLSGNVTAGSGTSTFTDVVINGSLNMNSGTSATVTGLSAPSADTDAATKLYVDTSISSLVDSAPGALDTLNELAAALGDDPNFATTITNSVATKLPLAGGTMSGAIAMGTNKVTGLGDPTANQDAATKVYVDTADALKLNLAGGTMTGNLVMGSNKVTSTATPTTNDDLTRKGYVDSILGSATSAADSAAAAATSETNAASSESNAAASASAAAASYDSFDDRYLGSKASAPTLDNDGNSLLTGALYWNTSSNSLFVWTGSAWSPAAFDTSGALLSANNLSDVANTATSRTNLGLGTGDSPAFVGLSLTGNITVDGTVDGRDVAADGTKLDGIEALADVTDTANVTAAGALMDSELTDIAAVKALNQGVATTDSPTFAGLTATTVDINGGTIDGTVIGGTTPAAVSGTTGVFSGELIAASYNETFASVTSTANATTINCEAGNVFSHTLTENTTFTFSNPPSTGTAYGMTIKLVQDATARTVTWPASVDWASATAPTISSGSGEVDVFVFFTHDGGATWYGFTAGQVMS